MWKKVATYICLLLAGVFLIAGIGFITKGFTEKDPSNWTIKERNELNLFDNTLDEVKEWNQKTGIVVTMNKDGSVKLDGKHGGTEAVTISLGKVTLDAGTYTFADGYKKSSTTTVYLKAVYGSSNAIAGTSDNIVLTAKTEVEVFIVINPDVNFNNVTLYPVIAAGTEEVSFYK